ncbi:cupin [Brevundimonas sp. LM2]|uniref:cupin-like domain-containing protein n=1 Tax=Brevundimonas sp. LM2 TaxID=1938605 RepID=UPI000983A69C|nr:cupin-like domain-containing protein [Brevundimonas sp. LM2]AQR61480.1 cupin [Brevundimonas sp. LM2]
MITRRTRVVETPPTGPLPLDDLLAQQTPVILRGLARDWPLTVAGRQGAQAAIDYLKRFDAGLPVVAYTAGPEIKGRYFYTGDMTGMNFEARKVPLGPCLDAIADQMAVEAPPSIYVGSTDLDTYLPGLRAENGLDLPAPAEGCDPAIVSIWLGNRTTAATHFDLSNNLACCLVGRRRFTLFPPDQIGNLYPGPMDPTPGGQVVSLVDLRAPDLERYPRFAAAAAAGEIAELEPGDVLFYPALWWHNVEALDPFNAMVNYWWNAVPAFMDPPMTTLLHGMLSLRDRPEPEKQAWRALFDHYVFGPGEAAARHLPEAARGDLAPLDERSARRLRARVLQKLNR